MNKKRLGDYPRTAIPAGISAQEVLSHLLNEQMGFGLVQLIEDDQASLSGRKSLQKVEVSFKKIDVIFAEFVCWRARRLGVNNRCEDLNAETRSNVKHFVHKPKDRSAVSYQFFFGFTSMRLSRDSRLLAFAKEGIGQTGQLFSRYDDRPARNSKPLSFQQFSGFRLLTQQISQVAAEVSPLGGTNCPYEIPEVILGNADTG